MGEKESSELRLVVGWLEEDGFLTMKEVAGLLGVPHSTAYGLMKRERVQRHHMGRWVCFKRTDIEQLMERLERRRMEKEG